MRPATDLVHHREQTKASLEAIRRTKGISPGSPRLGEQPLEHDPEKHALGLDPMVMLFRIML
jgi:hypothetical protein